MTRVLFRELPEEGALEMRVQGHAGFSEMGKDPVCAGASVLAFTVAQCIEVMEKKLEKKPHVTIGGGNVRVVAVPKPSYYAEAKHIFYVGEVGMRLLSRAYPGNVELTEAIFPAGDE